MNVTFVSNLTGMHSWTELSLMYVWISLSVLCTWSFSCCLADQLCAVATGLDNVKDQGFGMFLSAALSKSFSE